jgi:O-antigen ligase
MFLFRPQNWLFFLVLTLPLSISQPLPIPGGFAFVEATDLIIPLVLLLMVLTLPVIHSDIQLRKNIFRVPVFLFFAVGMVSFLKAAVIFPFPTLLDMMLRLIKWVLYYLMFELILCCSNEHTQLRALFIAFVLGTMATAFIGLHDYYFGQGGEVVARVGDVRVESTFEGVNKYGVFLAFSFFLTFGVLLKSRSGKAMKSILLPSLFLFFVSLILTYSRGAWFSFLVGAFSAIVLNNIRTASDSGRAKENLILLLCAGTLLFGFIVAAVLLPTVQARMESIFVGGGINVGGRAERWVPFLKAWLKNPIIGTGYYSWAYLPSIQRLSGGHNQFLNLLLDVGVLGTVIYTWLLVRVFRVALRCYRTTRNLLLRGLSFGFLVGFITILVSLFSGEFLYGSELIGAFWISIGIIYAGVEIERAQENASESVTQTHALKQELFVQTPHRLLFGSLD